MLASLFGGETARAACDPAAANNVSATCTGTTLNQNGTNGYGTGVETGLSVNVVSGATLTGNAFGTTFSTGTVTNAGTINSLDAFSRAIEGSALTVINTGTLISSSLTINTLTNLVLNNSGTILSTGTTPVSAGVNAQVSGVIVNSGTIRANEGNSGIGIAADLLTLTNSGFIAGGSVGVTGNGTITNSGTILATGTNGTAISFVGTLTNTGTITGNRTGVGASNNTSVINFGTISASSATTGIGIRGSGATIITNAGTVAGNSGTAILLTGAADTLTLLPGSRIFGAINMGGGSDVVNLVTGHDAATLLTLTNFTGTLNVSGPSPYVINGNQVATIEPTSFAMVDRALMDFTRGISGMLDGRGAGGTATGADTAFAAAGAVLKAPAMVTVDGTTVWAQGFGGEQTQDATAVLSRAKISNAGGALGFDRMVQPDLKVGAFLGAGSTQTTVDIASRADSNIAFGGVYGRWTSGAAFVSFAAHGGHLSNQTRRVVVDNLAGWVEIAQGKYQSWYASPELTFGYRYALDNGVAVTPVMRARYVASWLDGYTENGSAANLQVGGRTVQAAEERGELRLSKTTNVGGYGALTAMVFGGVLAVQRLGDTTIDSTLLGIALPFLTPGESNTIGWFAGAGVDWRMRNVTLFAGAEYLQMSDDSRVIRGSGGARVTF